MPDSVETEPYQASILAIHHIQQVCNYMLQSGPTQTDTFTEGATIPGTCVYLRLSAMSGLFTASIICSCTDILDFIEERISVSPVDLL